MIHGGQPGDDVTGRVLDGIAGVQAGHKKQLQVLSRKVRVGEPTNKFKIIWLNWVTELKTELKLSARKNTFHVFF